MAFSFKQLFNNNTIVLNPYGLISDKIENGLRIAHLSDLHEKSFGHHNEDLFAAIEGIEPDLIAVTGDLVAHENQEKLNVRYTEILAAGLTRIAPCYFVAGNHERQFASEIFAILESNDIRMVSGKVFSLDVRGSRVNISGVDDPVFGSEAVIDSVHAFDGVEGYNIFLSHRPELFETYVGKNVDLMLAGHTHAGQIRLPQVSSLYMMGQGFFPKYMEGEFVHGDTTMIISRGLGASGYPTVRINNPPDLVAIEVTNRQQTT